MAEGKHRRGLRLLQIEAAAHEAAAARPAADAAAAAAAETAAALVIGQSVKSVDRRVRLRQTRRELGVEGID